jgi:hypothetical protein
MIRVHGLGLELWWMLTKRSPPRALTNVDLLPGLRSILVQLLTGSTRAWIPGATGTTALGRSLTGRRGK